jgi:hypothetical protein
MTACFTLSMINQHFETRTAKSFPLDTCLPTSSVGVGPSQEEHCSSSERHLTVTSVLHKNACHVLLSVTDTKCLHQSSPHRYADVIDRCGPLARIAACLVDAFSTRRDPFVARGQSKTLLDCNSSASELNRTWQAEFAHALMDPFRSLCVLLALGCCAFLVWPTVVSAGESLGFRLVTTSHSLSVSGSQFTCPSTQPRCQPSPSPCRRLLFSAMQSPPVSLSPTPDPRRAIASSSTPCGPLRTHRSPAHRTSSVPSRSRSPLLSSAEPTPSPAASAMMSHSACGPL